MTQIIFCTQGDTVAAQVAGAVITTSAVQRLPTWAPPIQYVGTTIPWLAYYMTDGTTGTGKMNPAKKCNVFAYGRRSTLHSGEDCVCLSRITRRAHGDVVTGNRNLVVLTYRAIGEMVRP